MEILNYLKPDNPVALMLVRFLIGLCILWALTLVAMSVSLFYQRRVIKKSEDIEELADELVKILNEKENANKNSDEFRSKNPRPMTADGIFSNFCEDRAIRENGIIGRHIKAIFNAGLKESRLDVGELIKHTTNTLFQGNTFLKTLLASFIVIGLLGTLLGLTDSLAGLSPVLAKNTIGESSKELSMGLSNLFLHLKTAFAPSIWGVFFTVVGILIFSVYLRAICFPVKEKLERLTLTVWVPRLFLTTSQRLVDTLRVSEDQIQKNLEAIHDVVEMEKTIKTDVEDLSKKLKSTNKALVSMTDSANGLRGFTDSFVSAVSKLTSYQEEIRELYKQMVHASKIFHENVVKSAKNAEVFQANTQGVFEAQDQQLQTMFQSLKSYEDAYIKERTGIDSKMKAVLNAAEGTYKAMAERNTDVIKGVSKPLTEELSKIEETLQVRLAAITDRFSSFDAPISSAAEKIEGSLETVVNRMEALTQELQREFVNLNENISGKLTDLIKRVETQSSQLSESYKTQTETSKALEENVSTLSSNISSLNNSVDSLDKSSKAGQNVLSQMGEFGDFGKKIESLVNEMKESTKTQQRQSQELVMELGKSNKAQEKQTRELVKEIVSLGKKVDKQKRRVPSPGRRENENFGTTTKQGKKEPLETYEVKSKPKEEENKWLDFERSPILKWSRKIKKKYLR